MGPQEGASICRVFGVRSLGTRRELEGERKRQLAGQLLSLAASTWEPWETTSMVLAVYSAAPAGRRLGKLTGGRARQAGMNAGHRIMTTGHSFLSGLPVPERTWELAKAP